MSKGQITVVGVGYLEDHLTNEIKQEITNAEYILGHEIIVNSVKKYFSENAVYIEDSKLRKKSKNMNHLREIRSKTAVEYANQNKKVLYISNGDPQIFSYAKPILIEGLKTDVEIKILPGISSISAIGAKLGAPFRSGYSIIGLYDDESSKEYIFNKLKCAIDGNFVIAVLLPKHEIEVYPELFPEKEFPYLYPLEIKKWSRLYELNSLLKEKLPSETPIAICTFPEKKIITNVEQFESKLENIDIYSTVIIGNSFTKLINDKFIAIG